MSRECIECGDGIVSCDQTVQHCWNCEQEMGNARAMIRYCQDRIAFFQSVRKHHFNRPESDDRTLWLAMYDKLIAEKTAEVARHEMGLMGPVLQSAAE